MASASPPRDPRELNEFLRLRTRRQTRCYLAVLLLACVWPEEFPGGWVDHMDFWRHGNNAGGPHEEARLRAIRRAWEELGECGYKRLLVSESPSWNVSKRRRLKSPSTTLVDWLFTHGHEELLGTSWRAFIAEKYQQEQPPGLGGIDLDAIVARAMGSFGRSAQAIDLLERALVGAARESQRRARLRLLKAQLLLRDRTPRRAPEAMKILEEIESDIGTPTRVSERHLLSQVHLLTSFGLIRAAYYVKEDPYASLREGDEIVLASARLEQAEAFATLQTPRERAECRYVRAKIAVQRDLEGAHSRPCEDSERELLLALESFAELGDAIVAADLMTTIGSLAIWRLGTDKWWSFHKRIPLDVVRSTLRWFDAATHIAELTPTAEVLPLQRWARINAAVCCVRLLRTYRSSLSNDECAELVKRTHALLDRGLGPFDGLRKMCLDELEDVMSYWE